MDHQIKQVYWHLLFHGLKAVQDDANTVRILSKTGLSAIFKLNNGI